MTSETVTMKEEESRSAAVLLPQIDEGALNAELSGAIHATTRKLYEMAVAYAKDTKGKVVLTIGLEVSPQGYVVVRGGVESKVPRARPTAGHFWLSPGGNLVLENPRQQKLPLRDINAPPQRPVEFGPHPVPSPRDI